MYAFVVVLADTQSVHRWSVCVDTGVDTRLDRPLLCQVPHVGKST